MSTVLWLVAVTDVDIITLLIVVHCVRNAEHQGWAVEENGVYLWFFVFFLHGLIENFCVSAAVERVFTDIDLHILQVTLHECPGKGDVGRTSETRCSGDGTGELDVGLCGGRCDVSGAVPWRQFLRNHE